MDSSDLIRYWHAVELLQPQTIPDIKIRDKPHQPFIHDIDRESPLPWDPSSPLARQQRAEGRVWSHRFYAHWFASAEIDRVLCAAFGEEHGYREPQDRDVALFALRFSEDGRMVADSFVLSSAAWMLGRVYNRQDWTQGFDLAQREATNLAKEHLGGIVESDAYQALIDRVLELVGLSSFFTDGKRRSRVLSLPTDPKNAGEVGDDPLNSFILEDLANVASHLRDGTTSDPLSAYLARHDGAHRIDVTDDSRSEFLIDTLLPDRHPEGCWPAEDHRGLVHAQQLAVNRILGELRTASGIQSVNGPPGTGKTTMLRDIIAAVVTTRADVLASLSRASDAFAANARHEVEQIQDGGRTKFCYVLNEDLFGHEIVVASSNNGAVENVTMELPQRDRIDASWLDPDNDHFSDLAELLAGRPAWGLVSAKLGAKRNRTDFTNKFYYGAGDLPPAPGKDGAAPTARKAQGFSDWLKEKSATTWTTATRQEAWSIAVGRYRAAKAAAAELRSEATGLDARLKEAGETRRAELACRQAVEVATTAWQDAMRASESAASARQVLREAVQRHMDRMALHERSRPGLLANLRSLWGAYRRWANERGHIRQEEGDARADLAAYDLRERQREQAVAFAKKRVDEAQAALDQVTARRLRQHAELLALAHRLGAAHLVTWLRTDRIGRGADIELAEPWQLPGWRKARANVFMEALRLQRAFFEIEAKRVKANMDLAMGILAGGTYRATPSAAIRSAWATLFMAVPVLSSTFASFARSFRTLGVGEIGWLLIDEAGQATPQAAVGALWRARRAVVVGDPLQLTPVLTVPDSVLEHMRNAYGVDPYWIPSRLSAQGLADEANPVGRMLGPEGSKSWVGLPLVVHRRCDRPMFELANRIAYDGAMVYGTIPPKAETPASLCTGWIDVIGRSEDNWVPAEGVALMSLLDRLTAEALDPADISVITPFQDVRNQLRRLLKGKMVHGTIHTMQGKESSVVILVLGGRSDAPGARNWAVSEPNLLNVAATRAKRRFYIIGDRSDWCRRRLFHDIADLLPSPPPLAESRAVTPA